MSPSPAPKACTAMAEVRAGVDALDRELVWRLLIERSIAHEWEAWDWRRAEG